MTDRIVLPTSAAVELFNSMAEAMRPDPEWAAEVDRRCADLAAERAGKAPLAAAAAEDRTDEHSPE